MHRSLDTRSFASVFVYGKTSLEKDGSKCRAHFKPVEEVRRKRAGKLQSYIFITFFRVLHFSPQKKRRKKNRLRITQIHSCPRVTTHESETRVTTDFTNRKENDASNFLFVSIDAELRYLKTHYFPPSFKSSLRTFI